MRILIVEDETDLRCALAQALREEGYAVDVAADGEDGLFKAQGTPYDAVVLDLMLPRLDGWTVLQRLRQTHATPVLILTARDALHDRVQGLDLGADDYLVKPFALSELAARLRALIRRTAGTATSLIHLGDVTIDLAARKVTRAGEPVHLTAREYALLELLALHRGRLVTRSMIYDHLFDENDDTLSNLVDVYVSNVRKKLGRDLGVGDEFRPPGSFGGQRLAEKPCALVGVYGRLHDVNPKRNKKRCRQKHQYPSGAPEPSFLHGEKGDAGKNQERSEERRGPERRSVLGRSQDRRQRSGRSEQEKDQAQQEVHRSGVELESSLGVCPVPAVPRPGDVDGRRRE